MTLSSLFPGHVSQLRSSGISLFVIRRFYNAVGNAPQPIPLYGSAAESTSIPKKSIVQDDVVSKLVNTMMYDGKKATAEAVVYDVCTA